MIKKFRKIISFITCLIMIASLINPAYAVQDKSIKQLNISPKIPTKIKKPDDDSKQQDFTLPLKESNITEDDKVVPNHEQLEEVEILKGLSKKELTITWNDTAGVPEVITGQISVEGKNNTEKAFNFLGKYKKLFKLNDNTNEIKFNRLRKDHLGREYVRIDQYYKGVLVYGGQVVLQFSPEGDIISIISQVIPIKNATDSKPMLSEDEAVEKARNELGITDSPATVDQMVYIGQPSNSESSTLMFYPSNGRYRLTYEIRINSWVIYIDAMNGSLLKKFNNIKFVSDTGNGLDLFGVNRTFNVNRWSPVEGQNVYEMQDLNRQISHYSYDSSRPLPGILITSSTPSFNNPDAVSGIYNFSRVYDWYKNTFGRNSYDNNYAPFNVTVGYPATDGWNAWWDSSLNQFVFTTNDSSTNRPMTAALDIVAHEYTHAVIDSEVVLDYGRTAEGAIHETLADTMSIMIDSDDWTEGEDAFVNGGYIRNLQNPTYKKFPNDFESEPHRAGEILSYAAYKITSSLGRSKAQQIYYSTILMLPDHAGASYSGNETNEQLWRALGNSWKMFRSTVEAATSSLYQSDLGVVKESFRQVGIGPLGDSEVWEPNDYWWEAMSLSSNSSIDSYISTSYDDDFYKVNLTSTGTISLQLTNLPADYDLVLYGPDLSVKTSSQASLSYDEDIIYPITQTGTYYIRVIPYNGANSKASPYRLNIQYTNTIDNLEPDRFTPKTISFGTEYYGRIIAPNDTDYYKVNVSAAGSVSMWLDSLPANYNAFLCDSNWNVLGGSTHDGTNPEWVNWWAPAAGTYYVVIEGDGNYSNSPYKLNFAYYTSKLDNNEPSDAFAYPRGPLTSGNNYDGKIYNYVDEDFYKINVSTAKTITITLTNLPADYDLYLYKSDGTFVAKSDNAGTTSETIQKSVAAGTYVIAIWGYNGASNQTSYYRLNASF